MRCFFGRASLRLKRFIIGRCSSVTEVNRRAMSNREQSPAGIIGVARGTGRPDRPYLRGGLNACENIDFRFAAAGGRRDLRLRLAARQLPPPLLCCSAAGPVAGDPGPGHGGEPVLPLSVMQEFRAPFAPPGGARHSFPQFPRLFAERTTSRRLPIRNVRPVGDDFRRFSGCRFFDPVGSGRIIACAGCARLRSSPQGFAD
jgi:hypothetical protein